MAGHQQTELSYAWEKYMDYRLQGADLQVSAAEDSWSTAALLLRKTSIFT